MVATINTTQRNTTFTFTNGDTLTSTDVTISTSSYGNRKSDLQTIVFGTIVTAIDYYAFSNCTNLETITLSNNIVNIYSGAFTGCSQITDVVLPYYMTGFYDYIFQGCTSLTNVIFQNQIIIFVSNFQKCC